MDISLARAGADEDRLAREMAQAGGIAGTKELVRAWGNTQGKLASFGAGTAVVAGIDIALAAYDFTKARDDKGKFHAGLRAGAAAYALASGPYAPVVAAAVVVVSAVEAGMDARHAATLMEIYARAARDDAETARIMAAMARDDAQALVDTISDVHRHLAAADEAEAILQAKCVKREIMTGLAEIDRCVFWLTAFHVHAQQFVAIAEELLSWQSSYLDVAAAFRLAKVDPDHLKAAAEEMRTILGKTSGSFEKALQDYGRVYTELIEDEARSQPLLVMTEYVAYNCTEAASALVREADELALEALTFNNGTGDIERRRHGARTAELLDRIGGFGSSACQQFANRQGDEPERLLLRRWLRQVEASRESVSGFASEISKAATQ